MEVAVEDKGHKIRALQPVTAVLVAAVILLLCGAWGYFAPAESRSTALIYIVFSLLFLAAAPVLRGGNRIVEFILRVLLLLLIIALALALTQDWKQSGTGRLLRLFAMAIAALYAFGVLTAAYVRRLQRRMEDRRRREATPSESADFQNKTGRDG